MYIKKEFTIPSLTGISQKNIEEHLKLYAGYVNNANTISTLLESPDLDPYLRGELNRRFSFEYNGMRNHEYYFSSLEGGSYPMDPSSALRAEIMKQWGSYEAWEIAFTTLAKTRGIGWAVVWFDPIEHTLVMNWVDEQHLGHLNSCQFVMGIDMWEHAYVADYQPSGKAQYITDYLANINWKSIEERYEKLLPR
jgi:superoxide dismutase, Fe-Mn family